MGREDRYVTDLKLTAAGDLDCSLPGLQLVDGVARVAQQVRTALRVLLGEWEFDLDAGVPWFQSILGIKAVNLNDVERLLKDAMLAVDDVVSVASFDMSFSAGSRQLTIAATLTTTFGDTQVEETFP